MFSNGLLQVSSSCLGCIEGRTIVASLCIRLLRGPKCDSDHVQELLRILRPNAQAHDIGRDAMARGPLLLEPVAEEHVRRREREVRAEARALRACERVEERVRGARRAEDDREEPAEPAARPAGERAPRGVVQRAGLPLGVVQLRDDRGAFRVQEVAERFGVLVDLRDALAVRA